jgi:hypothetical protein
VTREKIDQAAKMYAQHFGDGTSDNPVRGPGRARSLAFDSSWVCPVLSGKMGSVGFQLKLSTFAAF